jgi:hypothetical protein
MKRTRKQSGHLSRALGEMCEQATAHRLHSMGYQFQKIETPCKVIGGRKVYTKKVAGDFMGCTGTGVGVLVECKTHEDGSRPVPSDFRPHQVTALKAWHNAGAVALVAWLDKSRALQISAAAEVLPLDSIK